MERPKIPFEPFKAWFEVIDRRYGPGCPHHVVVDVLEDRDGQAWCQFTDPGDESHWNGPIPVGYGAMNWEDLTPDRDDR